jgi:hypothetical protein
MNIIYLIAIIHYAVLNETIQLYAFAWDCEINLFFCIYDHFLLLAELE